MYSTAEINTLIFQIKSDILMQGFDDGALLLRLSDRHLIDTNQVGQIILELTDGQKNVQQIAEFLAQKYSIPESQALQDTLDFYNSLQTKKVVKKGTKIVEKETFIMSVSSTMATHYLVNPDVVLREEDEDGALLFNPDTNQVKVINPTGLFIWQQCDGKKGLAEIVKALVETYEDAPVDQITQDVQEFLDGMLQSGFIGTVE